MDPDETYKSIMELADLTLDSYDPESAKELAEALINLDEWIKSGGCLPSDWQTPENDKCTVEGCSRVYQYANPGHWCDTHWREWWAHPGDQPEPEWMKRSKRYKD